MSINMWTLNITGHLLTSASIVAGILNRDYTNSHVFRIWRVGLINAQTGGGISTSAISIQLERYVGASWRNPTVIGPISVDTKDTDTSALISGHGGTRVDGTQSVFRRITWFSTCASHSSTPYAAAKDWETFIPLGILWDSGFNDANVQPLTVRPGEMYDLYQTTAGQIVDAWIEFTDETS